jgi:hypothetical protein
MLLMRLGENLVTAAEWWWWWEDNHCVLTLSAHATRVARTHKSGDRTPKTSVLQRVSC